MGKITFQIYSDFDAVPDAYLTYFDSQENLRFEQTIDWYRALAKIMVNTKHQLRLYILVDDDIPLVFFPALFSDKRFLGFRYAQICSLSNYYTSLYLPGLNTDYDKKALAHSFAKQLLEAIEGWCVLEISPVSFEDDFISELSRTFQEQGSLVDKYFRFGNWSQEIDGDNFDDYYNKVSTRIRTTIRRKKRKITGEHDLQIKIVTEVDDLNKVLAEYEKIYDKSWKQAEPYMTFIREISKQFALKNCLRLGVLYVDGTPASSQIWIVYNQVASIFKLAYDSKFSYLSVGSILTKELMRYVIDLDKVKTIDYLIGDDAYKKDWMSVRRERFGIRVYRRGMLVTHFQSLYVKIRNLANKYIIRRH